MVSPTRITIPHTLASDLDNFRSIIKGGLEKAGCAACCSGIDIFYQREKMFRISEKLAVSPILSDKVELPTAKPSMVFEFDAAVGKDINRLMPALEKMLDVAGCPNCHSGLDLLFLNKQNVLEVQAFGRAAI
jgi:hypothetical protein